MVGEREFMKRILLESCCSETWWKTIQIFGISLYFLPYRPALSFLMTAHFFEDKHIQTSYLFLAGLAQCLQETYTTVDSFQKCAITFQPHHKLYCATHLWIYSRTTNQHHLTDRTVERLLTKDSALQYDSKQILTYTQTSKRWPYLWQPTCTRSLFPHPSSPLASLLNVGGLEY